MPIDPDTCDEFDPFKVPTLESLVAEWDENKDAGRHDYQGNE